MNNLKLVFNENFESEPTETSKLYTAVRALKEKEIFKAAIAEVREANPVEAVKARELVKIIRANDPFALTEFAEMIEKYFMRPFITDTFKNHEERKNFRKILPEEDRSLYESDAYRIGNLGAPIGAIQIIAMYVENSEITTHLKKLTDKAEDFRNQIEHEYRRLETYQERDTFIAELKTFLLEYLKCLGQELRNMKLEKSAEGGFIQEKSA